MELFGFDVDKQITKVTMPPAQIAELGIDPLRLDLFDPDPVRVRVSNLNCDRGNVASLYLRFTRLRKINFAYVDRDRGYIGAYDGKAGVCYSGSILQLVDRLRIGDPVLAAEGFVHHFGKYLQSAFRTNAVHLPCFLRAKHGAAAWAPFVTDNITFEQGAMVYRESTDALPKGVIVPNVHFYGSMLEPLSVPQQLPDEINWAIEKLSHWKVRVVGQALLDAFAGRPITSVHMLVNVDPEHEQGSSMIPLLNELGAEQVDNVRRQFHDSWLYFRRQGVNYLVFFQPAAKKDHYFDNCQTSILQMCAAAPNQVQASRIALHDLSRQQLRFGFRKLDLRGEPVDDCAYAPLVALTYMSLREFGFTEVATQLSLTDHAFDGMR